MGMDFRKSRTLGSRQSMHGKILAGLSFVALTLLTVKTFTPDIKSYAETRTAEQTVGPYTMSISTDSLTSINITPTSSQAVYTGTSAISYTNTCPHGFNVTMSSVSENTSLTRTGSDSGPKEISTISSGTALADNAWGFSKDNGSTYSPIPAISATPVNIINTFEATNNPVTINLIYGVKTDNSLPSGSYTNNLVYTVSAKTQCLSYGITWDLDGGIAASDVTYPTSLNFGQTVDLTSLTPSRDGYEFTSWSNGTNTFDGTETAADINPTNFPSLTMTAQWEQVLPMQDFSCSTLTNVGDSVKLRDTRDNNIYTVKKLADGKCWMTENLRLIDKTISSADSNLPSGETYTVPASDLSSFTESYNTNSAYLDSTYGGYYSFYTTTAGWGTNSVTSGSSPKDICPKGWRLPTGGSSGEFNTLYGQYDSVALMIGVPNFTLSGDVYNGSVLNQGSLGYFWSSTVYDANNAYSLYLSSSDVYPAGDTYKRNGFSVRCVAKEPTMQTFESSMLQNVGDSMQLEDERDGNKYTVKKLADGNIWMTDNLRLVNKTISSADSNLPSGETWTIPASSTSGFSSYNTNNAYLDSTFGGYYTFYTATAGWGTNSVASGSSPKDICPKGWRLPTGGDSGEFKTLYSNYNSTVLIQGEPNFTLSGRVFDGSVRYQGGSGFFWSSTVYNANGAYNLNLNSSYVNPADGDYVKNVGFSVRCVVEDRTISDITYMQDMTSKIAENTPINAVATLTDIRDNNTYTVRKLKDGKIWMTQNLRITEKTITSANSNVTSDFIIPVSSLSGFNGTQDTNNAYVDDTYGGYYTFYTATAGTGGTSLASGNAPSSICPKGWRLPTGGESSGEFQTLYNNYNSSALMQGEPNFTLSGSVGYGSMRDQGFGLFWSSTVSNANSVYTLYLGSSKVYPAYNFLKYNGFSVRCVAV